MLVIQIISLFLCLVLGSLLAGKVHALGLSQLIDLGTREAHQQFLGEAMVDNIACSTREGMESQ